MNKYLIKFTLSLLVGIFCQCRVHAQLGGSKFWNSNAETENAILNDSEYLDIYTHYASPTTYDTLCKEICLHKHFFTFSYFVQFQRKVAPRFSITDKGKIDSTITGQWHFCHRKKDFKKFSTPSIVYALETNTMKLIILKYRGQKRYALMDHEPVIGRLRLVLQENDNFFKRFNLVTSTEFISYNRIIKSPVRKTTNNNMPVSIEGY